MEVIIHGKPLDSSERFTTGIDKMLARKIIDEFFSISTIKEPEALIVDARYWQKSWTSVYTLFLSQNVKDTAGRGSYFAISLVLPHRYCGMVSDVYYLLEKVVKENVLGIYLNSSLQYIVRNFEDSTAFDQLCAKLQTCYTNIEKAFDSSFKAQATFSNDTYCSIDDCDSLAFVKLLRNKGRIIVTEKEDTKDALAAKSSQYQQEAQNAIRDIQAKTVKITELRGRITQLESDVQKASSSSSGKLSKLEQQVKTLTEQNQRINREWQTAQSQLAEIRKKIGQAVEILGVPELRLKGQMTTKEDDLHSDTKKRNNSFWKFLPAINTLLILFIVIGLFANTKSCSSDDKSIQEAAEAKAQVELLNGQLAEKENEITSLRENNEALMQQRDDAQNSMRQLQERSVVNSVAKTTARQDAKPKRQTPAESAKVTKEEPKKEPATDNKKEQPKKSE